MNKYGYIIFGLCTIILFSNSFYSKVNALPTDSSTPTITDTPTETYTPTVIYMPSATPTTTEILIPTIIMGPTSTKVPTQKVLATNIPTKKILADFTPTITPILGIVSSDILEGVSTSRAVTPALFDIITEPIQSNSQYNAYLIFIITLLSILFIYILWFIRKLQIKKK